MPAATTAFSALAEAKEEKAEELAPRAALRACMRPLCVLFLVLEQRCGPGLPVSLSGSALGWLSSRDAPGDLTFAGLSQLFAVSNNLSAFASQGSLRSTQSVIRTN